VEWAAAAVVNQQPRLRWRVQCIGGAESARSGGCGGGESRVAAANRRQQWRCRHRWRIGGRGHAIRCGGDASTTAVNQSGASRMTAGRSSSDRVQWAVIGASMAP
jgi:hypothetical protein